MARRSFGFFYCCLMIHKKWLMFFGNLSFVCFLQFKVMFCFGFSLGLHPPFLGFTPRPFLMPFLLPSWRAVWSYRPHLEERDPIWDDGLSHSLFIRRSPSWGFLGFSSAVRQIPGDLCTAPGSFHYHPYLSTDMTDPTLRTSGFWLGTRTGAGGNARLTKIFFGRSPWLHGQQVLGFTQFLIQRILVCFIFCCSLWCPRECCLTYSSQSIVQHVCV